MYMNNQYNLIDFEATFREFLISQNVAPITIKNYLSDLRHFLGWLPIYLNTKSTHIVQSSVQNLTQMLKQVQHDAIQDYCSYLSQNQTPLKTINRRLSTLRKFFSFCISQGWTTHNPAKKVTNITKNIPSSEVEKQFSTGSNNNEKAHNNNLILTTEVIEKSIMTEKELLAHYSQYLTLKKLNEKEILQINTDIKEFFTIINFPQKGTQL